MALPSSRRPAAVQREKELEDVEVKKEILKITPTRETKPRQVSDAPMAPAQNMNVTRDAIGSSEPQPCSSGSLVSKASMEQPKREVKKLVDLSNEPPPGWWLQSYAKGIVLPRKLLVHSTEDQNIIFYDYTQDPNDVVKTPDGTFVGRVHDKDGVQNRFDWWAGQMQKEKEAEERKNFKAAIASGYVWPL